MADTLIDYIPLELAFLVLLAVVWGGGRYLQKRHRDSGEHIHVRAQLVYIVLVAVAVILVILALPVDTDVRNALLSLFGLLVTAVIGLAATTHVANALAGLMLRSRRSFKPGDFIRAQDHFGRVVDLGLFHTEIQTEDRDMTSLPNVVLATQPFTVVHGTGTVVSATVSLGYDEPRLRIQELLKSAAAAASLKEPFVQIMDLGDFSVTYRVGGLLEQPKTLLTARSNLRAQMLDHLHGSGVEIVSPTFMNQRQTSDEPVVPSVAHVAPPDVETGDIESIAFDKAEEAASVEQLRERLSAIDARIDELEGQLAASTNGEPEKALRLRIENLTHTRDLTERALAERDSK